MHKMLLVAYILDVCNFEGFCAKSSNLLTFGLGQALFLKNNANYIFCLIINRERKRSVPQIKENIVEGGLL